MGCTKDICDVIAWEPGTFYIAATVRHRVSMATWVIVSVYGPADHARSVDFLGEITTLVGAKRAANMLFVVGGDFNLIRSGADKNNDNVDWARVSLSNNAIAAAALCEIATTCVRLRWTNKQHMPVCSVLDHVFCTGDWEVLFPLCTLVAETCIGSNQVPLTLSSGEDIARRSRRLFFKTAWFEAEGFAQMVTDRWELIGNQLGRQRGPVEFWSSVVAPLRAFLRGWGAN